MTPLAIHRASMISRDVISSLRSYDFDSIQPKLRRYEREELHAIISMAFHELAKDLMVEHLDAVFKQRIRQEQVVLGTAWAEIRVFNRERSRIESTLDGDDRVKALHTLLGKNSDAYRPWCNDETILSIHVKR